MKRLSRAQLIWLARHAAYSAKRKQQSRLAAKKRRGGAIGPKGTSRGRHAVIMYRTYSGPALVSGESRPVPAVLSLAHNYVETVEFLGEYRESLVGLWNQKQAAATRRRRHGGILELGAYWDFTAIQRMTPAVALIVASELDRFRRRGGGEVVAVDVDKWRPEVRWMLDEVGFLEMVGAQERSAAIREYADGKMLRFRSGMKPDGAKVAVLLNELGVAANPEIYDAIVEALVNTRHHAYPKEHEFSEPHVPGWWLSGMVQPAKRRVRISAFDHGLSIPATLPKWDRYAVFQQLFRRGFKAEPDPNDRRRDGDAISTAMEVGRSSTGEEHRGKGLHAIEAVIDHCQDGNLAIISRCGEYRRRKGEAAPLTRNWNAALGGTLIIWDVGI